MPNLTFSLAGFGSLKSLGWCWAGLAAVAGAGALALQVTAPEAVRPAPASAAAPASNAQPPAPAPVAPVPFQNRSLFAMLPPPVEHAGRPVIHPPVEAALPVPPVPPAPQRTVRAEPRRVTPVYAAEPQPDYPAWGYGRPMPYPGQFAAARRYEYAAPPAYYGWQPYD